MAIIAILCYITASVTLQTPWKWREIAMGGSLLMLLFLFKSVALRVR